MATFKQAASFTHGSPFLENVQAGSAIIGAVLWAGNPGLNPVDNEGNVWSPVTAPFSAQPSGNPILHPFLQMFWINNVRAGVLRAAFASNNGVMASFLLEYSGITSLIKAVGTAGFGGQDKFVSPNVIPNVNDLLIAVAVCNGTGLTPGGGFIPRVVMLPPGPTVTVSEQNLNGPFIGGNYQAVYSAYNVDNYAVVMGQFR